MGRSELVATAVGILATVSAEERLIVEKDPLAWVRPDLTFKSGIDLGRAILRPLHAWDGAMSNQSTRVAMLSGTQIWLASLASGLFAAGFAIFLQWLIYDDWLHEAGPVEIAGSVLAGLLMFVLVFRTLHASRQKKKEMIEQLEEIRWMNDRIRNSLQTIECITYAAAPQATDDVRSAVDVIEGILNGFLVDRQQLGAMRDRQTQGAGAMSDAQLR